MSDKRPPNPTPKPPAPPKPPKMTAARALAICEEHNELDGIAELVADAPPLSDETVALLRAAGLPREAQRRSA